MKDPPEPKMPSFGEALRYWLRLGCLSFGGPAGQISMMHRDLVQDRRWIGETHFLHALNFCMLLPGPEAQQLATYLGWRLHGAKGGIAAGALFVLPSAFLIYGLSWLYFAGGHLPWLAAAFHGLLPAVIAIVATAVLRIAKNALTSPALAALSAASFAAIYFLGVSFVLIVAAAALVGACGHRLFPGQFATGKSHGGGQGGHDSQTLVLPAIRTPTVRRNLVTAAFCIFLWWAPILLLGSWLGWASAAAQQGLFFSKAALVTFGGAYAVLPYVAQQAVESHGWLSHAQMMAGLALAETTPGPLIIVLQFVGFAGGWQQHGSLLPLAGATLGAAITTWTTFLPSFLLVFLGAPHIERLGKAPRLGAALAAITAAVVGVILSLGVKFATQAMWPEPDRNFDPFVATVAVAALFAIRRLNLGLASVIGACSLLGLAWWTVRLLFSCP